MQKPRHHVRWILVASKGIPKKSYAVTAKGKMCSVGTKTGAEEEDEKKSGVDKAKKSKSATVEEGVKKSVALDTPRVHMWSGIA